MLLFPLPYDGSPIHAQSWEAAKALQGKRVSVVTDKGECVTGKVHSYGVSSSSDRRSYGVGFTLICGSDRFPYNVPINAALQSIEIVA